MAIVIPSKKIYELNNQKVIKNSIKSIETSQANNEIAITENEQPLFQTLEFDGEPDVRITQQGDARKFTNAIESFANHSFGWAIRAKVSFATQKISLARYFKRPILKDDVYITEIDPTIEAEFNLTISNVACDSYIGSDVEKKFVFNDSAEDNAYNMRDTKSYNFNYDDIKTNYYDSNIKITNALTIQKEKISAQYGFSSPELIGEDGLPYVIKGSASAIEADGDFLCTFIKTADINHFNVEITMAKELTVWVASDYALNSNDPAPRIVEAQKYVFTLKSAKIVYNENIRHISSTQEQKVYTNNNAIGSNNYSVDQSQFINTNATYDGIEDAPKILLENTLALYEKGKETAIVRCSIGDYWDNNGNTAISIETDSKMMFEHYDEVVPMFKNSLGMDEPISYNENKLAKTFEVVGIKTIFDGAVWQELTLREKGALSLKLTLPTPRLHLGGDILTVTDPSGLATQFRLYANGRMKGIYNLDKDKNTFNFILSMQNLNSGVNYLAVTSWAEDYNESPMSRTFAYYVKPKVEVVTEVNESGGLTYRITADEYKVVDGTYIIGD